MAFAALNGGAGNEGVKSPSSRQTRMIGRRQHPVGEQRESLLGGQSSGFVDHVAGLEARRTARRSCHDERGEWPLIRGTDRSGAVRPASSSCGQAFGPLATEHDVARLRGGLVLEMEEAELPAERRLERPLVNGLAVQFDGERSPCESQLDRVPLTGLQGKRLGPRRLPGSSAVLSAGKPERSSDPIVIQWTLTPVGSSRKASRSSAGCTITWPGSYRNS